MSVFYDTHAHLDYPDFAGDLPQVIDRAQAAGITRIVAVGTDLASSRRAIELSQCYPAVYAAVGWHPSEAERAPDDLRPALRQLATHAKVVALGETGLDYHRLPSEGTGFSSADDGRYKAKQAALFRQHLEVALELGLNCVIHQREALADILTQMEPFVPRVRGVFHCFVEDAAAARRVFVTGSIVSFTGIVTFKNGQNVRDTLSALPPDRFLFETDSPYLAPVPYRGKRAEPAYVKVIAETVAKLRNCSLNDLSAATCATAHNFFPKMG